MIKEEILKIEGLLKESHNIVFLTGAGISTNSGLPDFRSDNGFWKTNKPISLETSWIAINQDDYLGPEI